MTSLDFAARVALRSGLAPKARGGASWVCWAALPRAAAAV